MTGFVPLFPFSTSVLTRALLLFLFWFFLRLHHCLERLSSGKKKKKIPKWPTSPKKAVILARRRPNKYLSTYSPWPQSSSAGTATCSTHGLEDRRQQSRVYESNIKAVSNLFNQQWLRARGEHIHASKAACLGETGGSRVLLVGRLWPGGLQGGSDGSQNLIGTESTNWAWRRGWRVSYDICRGREELRRQKKKLVREHFVGFI